MRAAAYVRADETVVAPTSLELAAGERRTYLCASAREAEGVAMMAAALARATAGSVTIGDYDPRVQPVHCKRIAAFVPHDPLPLSRADADRFLTYRAALWDIDDGRARARAQEFFERLQGLHEAFAYPIVAAMLPEPQLLVIDRPQMNFVPQILAAADCAVLITQSEPLA